MSALDRRGVLWLSMAMLPALASRPLLAQDGETAPAGLGPITPPELPMVYTRRLERALSGNARIVVERSFTVHFVASGSGFVIDGQQSDVSVEMPPSLAPLSEMERTRMEIGLFPLVLDASGRIVSGPSSDQVPEIERAVQYVTEVVAKLDRSEGERQAMTAFIAAVHQAGNSILSCLPVDLFAPAPGERTEQRAIQLPDGGEGTVETRFTALRDPATGLLRHARRDVVTTIGGDARHSRELFTLTV